MIRALFLTILYAHAQKPLQSLSLALLVCLRCRLKEWKEDFKNGFFLLFLTLGSSLSCFSDWNRTFLGELLSAPLFSSFWAALESKRWVIADGKNTEHKEEAPFFTWPLLLILVSFLSSSTVFTVQRSVPPVSRCDGVQWKTGYKLYP